MRATGIGAAAVLVRGQRDNAAHAVTSVKALVFDVFGTVVDWRGSIIEEGQAWGKTKGMTVDWASFCGSMAGRLRAFYGQGAKRRNTLDQS